MMVIQQGELVEFFITPGSFSNVKYLDQFDFDLPPGLTVYADKIYNSYLVEDCLQEDDDIEFCKSNSQCPDPLWKRFSQHHYRKIVDTSDSLIERLLSKYIHATNSTGFELKVILFIWDLMTFIRLGTRYTLRLGWTPTALSATTGNLPTNGFEPIWGNSLDTSPYRYQRILYRLMARSAAFGLLQDISWSLLGLNLVALAVGTFMMS